MVLTKRAGAKSKAKKETVKEKLLESNKTERKSKTSKKKNTKPSSAIRKKATPREDKKKNEIEKPSAKRTKTALEIKCRPAAVQKTDPFEVAKRAVKGSVPAIVNAMVKAAKQGSCTHAKTLLEMTGAKRMFDESAEDQGRGDPWAKLVLERLGEAETAAEGTTSEEIESVELRNQTI